MVTGELDWSFASNQFGLTFPLFKHCSCVFVLDRLTAIHYRVSKPTRRRLVCNHFVVA
jgi:hypothetical protein